MMKNVYRIDGSMVALQGIVQLSLPRGSELYVVEIPVSLA